MRLYGRTGQVGVCGLGLVPPRLNGGLFCDAIQVNLPLHFCNSWRVYYHGIYPDH